MSPVKQEEAALDLEVGVDEDVLPKELADPTHPRDQGPGDQTKVTQGAYDWELWSPPPWPVLVT